MQATIDAGVIRGVCVASMVGFVANRIAKAIGPDDFVDQYPRWQWLVGLIAQVLVYPSLFFLAWFEKGLTTAWLCCQWSDHLDSNGGGMQHEYLLIYAVSGYMIKDSVTILSKRDRWTLGYHVLSLAMVLFILYIPSGVGIGLGGVVLLELGSAFYATHRLNHQSLTLAWLYVFAMSVANFLCLVLIAWFTLLPNHFGFKMFYFVFGLGLLIARQKEVARTHKKLIANITVSLKKNA